MPRRWWALAWVWDAEGLICELGVAIWWMEACKIYGGEILSCVDGVGSLGNWWTQMRMGMGEDEWGQLKSSRTW